MNKWNPRFVAYAKFNGNTPEKQLEIDNINYPGGCMCGFILWIRKKIGEFYKLHRECFIDVYTLIDQEKFTKFLFDKKG